MANGQWQPSQMCEKRGFRSWKDISLNRKKVFNSTYAGAGNLVNGQWWPLPVCAERNTGCGS